MDKWERAKSAAIFSIQADDAGHNESILIGRLIEAGEAKMVKQEKALKTANQAILEINHAQMNGPDWYTKGESGMFQQVRMWIGRASDAITDALEDDK